jgi:hypothetical protein
MTIRAYTARRMTGEVWSEIYAAAEQDWYALRSHGITALDPVLMEVQKIGYVPSGRVGEGALGDPELLLAHWRRDKRMIRRAHVLIDMSPEHKSEGIAHEIGYARYALWKPVVRVYPPGRRPTYSVACFEDDAIVDSLQDAAFIIGEEWGTWWRRFKWRARMYLRSAPRHYWFKLIIWFQ